MCKALYSQLYLHLAGSPAHESLQDVTRPVRTTFKFGYNHRPGQSIVLLRSVQRNQRDRLKRAPQFLIHRHQLRSDVRDLTPLPARIPLEARIRVGA